MKTETMRNWMIEAEDENENSFTACIKAHDAGEAWMNFDKAHIGVKWAKIHVYSTVKVMLNIDGREILKAVRKTMERGCGE